MTESRMPLLVVVTGPPGAGKTTIARGIAERLQLPLIAKDTIKEALFDGLGVGDVEWSQRVGTATYLAMLGLLEDSVAAGASVVAEANFVCGSELETRLAALPAGFVQIHCTAPLELLLERYGTRERHPGQSIVRHELGRMRIAELGLVDAVYPHSGGSDDDNYGCDVRLKNSDLLLKRVPFNDGDGVARGLLLKVVDFEHVRPAEDGGEGRA